MEAPPYPELSVLIVSYGTRELTLACLRSLEDGAAGVSTEVVVVDNASVDGSARAIAEEFPDVLLVELEENIGFGRAVNLAATRASGESLLLLNPDTVVLDGAIRSLLAFARSHPEAGICGGRTLYADGSVNPTFCWRRLTPWSLVCYSSGLTKLFPHSRLFHSTGIGYWWQGEDREVDIVSGCFFLIERELWNRLDGFDPRFFLYGEEADLCLRARELGYRPMVTTTAEIVHHGGASDPAFGDKQVRIHTANVGQLRKHWNAALVAPGILLLSAGAGIRAAAYSALSLLAGPRFEPQARCWREVWSRRSEWGNAFREGSPAPSGGS